MNAASSQYNYHVHYALKANSNREILDRILKSGMGADCVSGNEIKRALESGFTQIKLFSLEWGRMTLKSDLQLRMTFFVSIVNHCRNWKSLRNSLVTQIKQLELLYV